MISLNRDEGERQTRGKKRQQQAISKIISRNSVYFHGRQTNVSLDESLIYLRETFSPADYHAVANGNAPTRLI